MVAMAILSVALLSMISVIITNMKLDRLTREYNIAQNAANLELERVMSLPYNDDILVGMNLDTNPTHSFDFDVRGLGLLPVGTGSPPNPYDGKDYWHEDSGGTGNTTGYVRIARVEVSEVSMYENTGDTDFVDTSGGYNLVRILVRVDWKGADGNPKHFILRSLRSDRGANAVIN